MVGIIVGFFLVFVSYSIDTIHENNKLRSDNARLVDKLIQFESERDKVDRLAERIAGHWK